jgi:hypothetical protein
MTHPTSSEAVEHRLRGRTSAMLRHALTRVRAGQRVVVIHDQLFARYCRGLLGVLGASGDEAKRVTFLSASESPHRVDALVRCKALASIAARLRRAGHAGEIE